MQWEKTARENCQERRENMTLKIDHEYTFSENIIGELYRI